MFHSPVGCVIYISWLLESNYGTNKPNLQYNLIRMANIMIQSVWKMEYPKYKNDACFAFTKMHINTYGDFMFSITRIRKTKEGHDLSMTYPILFIADHHEFCHNERFTAECGPNEVIVMTLGRCAKKDYGYIRLELASSISHTRTAREDGRVRFKFLMPFEIRWVNRVRRISSYFRAAYRCQRGRL